MTADSRQHFLTNAFRLRPLLSYFTSIDVIFDEALTVSRSLIDVYNTGVQRIGGVKFTLCNAGQPLILPNGAKA